MSNHNQQTSNQNTGKGQNPSKPNLPGPGKNPDFPEDEPVGPGTGGGTGTTPTEPK